MIAMNKRQLRAELRARHEGAEARNAQSSLLCRHILQSEAYQKARVVAGYMPMSREADVTEVLQDVLRSGKTLALPLCGTAPHMTLRRVESLDDLTPGAYGIMAPQPNAPVISVQEVDLLLVPLEGIDGQGYRLGKGGGYYDHLLALAGPITIGCALSWQRVKALPWEEWDIPLTACADWRGLHVFQKQQIDGKEKYHGHEEEQEKG